MTLPSGRRLGLYEIIAPLGAGGMGEVYRARDTKLDRDVALKILPESFASDPDRLMRFEREAKTLASLNHPHIAQVYAVDGSALVMELVEGEDLAERIARGPIPLEEAIPIARQVAEALEAAHEAGIIHRDLKPANIKVRTDGTVKVLDFGLAKADPGASGASSARGAGATVTSPAVTHAGMILGTAAYMSPEQAKGKAVDKRTDIWAFGCVLYEMLTGRRVFDGDDVTDTLAAIMRDSPTWEALPATTPASLRRLMARCLERDPKQRLRDIGDARLELDTSPGDAVERPLARGSSASAWTRRAAWIALGAFITSAGLVAMMWSRAPASRPVERFVLTSVSDIAVRPDDTGPDLSLTPDGQRVIYRALRTDPEGVRVAATQLVMRAMTAFEATPLASLGLAPRMPFTSPDGAWVGFETVVGAQVAPVLAKAPVAGGPMVVLCDLGAIGALRGGSWDAQGRIVFATSQRAKGLMEIQASGGTPREITQPDRARGELDHVWPVVLPDGAGILFTIARESSGFDVAVLPAGASTWRTLIQGAAAATYMSSGHLIYVSSGALYGVGFDLKTLTVTTEPVPLVRDVMTKASGAANFAIASNGTLAYVPGGRRQRLARLVWLNRDGTTTALPLEAGEYGTARLSPDGKRFAVPLRERDMVTVWVYDISRDAFTRVTPREESMSDPVWSPDGRRLAVWSEKQKALFAISTDGSDAPMLLVRADSGTLYPSAWSPDGTMLAFIQEAPNLDTLGVSLSPPHTVRPLAFGSGAQVEVSFSPDGKWITYASFDGTVPEIIVAPASGEGRKSPVAPTGRYPRWSADGRQVLYREGSALFSVTIDGTSGMAIGRPVKILGLPQRLSSTGAIEMTSDGRFLMLEAMDTASSAVEIRVVRNWDEEVRAWMAGARRPGTN